VADGAVWYHTAVANVACGGCRQMNCVWLYECHIVSAPMMYGVGAKRIINVCIEVLCILFDGMQVQCCAVNTIAGDGCVWPIVVLAN